MSGSDSAPSTVGDKSLGELVALATKDMSTLIRAEIALAKLEVRDDVKRVGVAATLFAAAAFLGYLALILLSIALAFGLVALGMAQWAGFGVVAGGYLIGCAICALIGVARLRGMTGLKRTQRSLRRLIPGRGETGRTAG